MTIVQSHGPRSSTYRSLRLDLHFVWGEPDAPPLILVHGGRDHCRSWDWVAQELQSDWRIIAPDLRGHGRSSWSPDANYSPSAYVCDLLELVDQLELPSFAILAHSQGGSVSLRFAGLYPERVHKLIAIEGLGFSANEAAKRNTSSFEQRWRSWLERRRAVERRPPRRYTSIEAAQSRMQAANPNLTSAQAHHLTIHGLDENGDQTFSWKFDNHVRFPPPVELELKDLHRLWSLIDCPTLHCYGRQSWASDPDLDGRLEHFRDARLVRFNDAGHWLHHDQFDLFMQVVRDFL